MSANSSGVAFDVRTGTWTDWSRGRVLGATLTLTRENGNLLIAFLAFFVFIVGTRFWRLACLLLHYFYSKDSGDAVHQQRQVFLRNAPNPEEALWTLAHMGWRRGKSERIWSRLWPILGLATACVAGFTLAGGFSSKVATRSGGEVLLVGANCGFLFNSSGLLGGYKKALPLGIQHMAAAMSYAEQCYDEQHEAPTMSCNTFVRKNILPAVIDTNASCPFQDRVCKKPHGNLYIDSGLLDSHDDFGRNTSPNKRLKFRRTLSCAPLATTDGYRRHTYDSHSNQSYTEYFYGPSLRLEDYQPDFNSSQPDDWPLSEETKARYTTQYLLNNLYPNVSSLLRFGHSSLEDVSLRYDIAHAHSTPDETILMSQPVAKLVLVAADTNIRHGSIAHSIRKDQLSRRLLSWRHRILSSTLFSSHLPTCFTLNPYTMIGMVQPGIPRKSIGSSIRI